MIGEPTKQSHALDVAWPLQLNFLMSVASYLYEGCYYKVNRRTGCTNAVSGDIKMNATQAAKQPPQQAGIISSFFSQVIAT